jgi:hypothetical protein
MKKIIWIFMLLIFITSCGLNSAEEKSLNMAITRYLHSVNTDLKLSRVAATHPQILKYYKAISDESFKKKFEKEKYFWTDALIGKIARDSENIHVELKLLKKENQYAGAVGKRFSLFAMSDDNGNTWYFAEEEDYKSKKIGSFKRLLL